MVPLAQLDSKLELKVDSAKVKSMQKNIDILFKKADSTAQKNLDKIEKAQKIHKDTIEALDQRTEQFKIDMEEIDAKVELLNEMMEHFNQMQN